MAFNGNLTNFRLGDILQTLWQNQTWGVLRVQANGQRREMVVTPHGVALLDICNIARVRIEERLLHRGCIRREDLTKLRARENSRRPLQEMLREVPGFDFAQLPPVLEAEADEQIQHLLEWSDGTFEFLEGEPPREMAELKPRDTSSLVLDAARRLDEKTRLGSAFPHPEERFVAIEVPEDLGSATARMVLEHLDGRSSLRAVADRTTGEFFAAAKIAAELEQAGWARRLNWDELVALGDELGKAQDVDSAHLVYNLAESAREIPNTEALFDLAIRRTAAGDKSGAALTLATAARQFESEGDFERAATCLRQAIPLSPRDVAVRRQHIDALKKCNSNRDPEIYESLRDLVILLADRGENTHAEVYEAEVLPRVPPVAEEEASVGRALGQLGRRTAAASLLARAAKNRSRDRKGADEAIALYREALQLTPENSEVRNSLDKLLRSKSTQRWRTVVLVAAVLLLGVGVAFPIRGILMDQAEESRFKQARLLAEKGDGPGALILLDQLEAEPIGSKLLEQCQLLRSEITKKSDERRKIEETDTDDWIRKQFASAADAIDARNYGFAVELYESILHRRNDEHRMGLVSLRMTFIDGRLRQETRRVRDLTRALSKFGKGAVITEPTSLRELRALAKNDRMEATESIRERIADIPLAKAVSKPESLREAIQLNIESLKEAQKEISIFETRIADSKELLELESVLLEARSAEAEGEPRVALKSFETLQSRYRGTALKSYFAERAKHWTIVVRQLGVIESAIARGDTVTAEAEVKNLHRLDPNIKAEHVLQLEREISSLPQGASVRLNGEVVGTTPLKIDGRKIAGKQIELQLKGFEPAKVTADNILNARVEVELSILPSWRLKLPVAASGEGSVSGNHWYVADRSGRVAAYDIENGTEIWKRQLDTLGGITGNPMVHGGKVYLVTREGLLACLRESDGTVENTIRLANGLYSSPPVLLTGESENPAMATIAIPSEDAHIQLVNLPEMGPAREARLTRKLTAPLATAGGGFAAALADRSIQWISRTGEVQTLAQLAKPADSLFSMGSGRLGAAAGTSLYRIALQSRELQLLLEVGETIRPNVRFVKDEVWYATGSEVLSLALAAEARPRRRSPASAQMVIQFGVFGAECALSDTQNLVFFSMEGTPRWKLRLGSPCQFVQLTNDRVGIVSDAGDIAVIPLGR